MKQGDEISKIIRAECDVRYLIQSLDFSDEEVVEVAKSQPKLYLEAVRYRIQKMRSRCKAESAYALAKSTTAMKIRAKLKISGDRVTEGQVSEKLLRNPELCALQAAMVEATVQEEFAKLLVEAYRMRRDSVKITADLIGAEMYWAKADGNVTGQGELRKMRKNLEKKYPGRTGRLKDTQ